MSPFFDGTLIELGAGGADVTVKKDETRIFVDTQLYGGVSERTGEHLSFVTEVEVGEPYRDLGFFSGRQARSVRLHVRQLADGSHRFRKRRRSAFVWVQTPFFWFSRWQGLEPRSHDGAQGQRQYE